MTKKIELVLISSLLLGCTQQPTMPTNGVVVQKEEKKEAYVGNTHWWYFHHNGPIGMPTSHFVPHTSGVHVSHTSGGFKTGGFRAAPSARGGFGGAGHSFGGTGA